MCADQHRLHKTLVCLFVLGVVLAMPLQVDAAGPDYHTVAWGETLYSIARLYSISPQDLAQANGLGSNTWVYAGQRLLIPGTASHPTAVTAPQRTPSGTYTIRAGDTLFSIAQRFGLAVDTLAAANDIPPNGVIYIGWQLKIATGQAAPAARPATQSISTSSGSFTSYIVQPGDTLFLIAFRHNTTTQGLALANNLGSLFIYSGQRLLVPNSNTSANSASLATNNASGVRVSGIPVYRQQQTLTCEESAAAMALRGALSERQIVNAMPRSDDPFAGIRGSTASPLLGGLDNYGTYAQGLQKGLAALGRASTVLNRQAFGDFKNSILQNLRAGHPVIWWTTWRQTYQTPTWVRTFSGRSVKLVPYEHTVLIVAANDVGVTFNDPYDGAVRSIAWGNMQRVSAYFDNMALVVQ